MNKLILGLASLVAGFPTGGFGGGYTPPVHKPLPTDDARNLAAAEAKRERKRKKRGKINAD